MALPLPSSRTPPGPVAVLTRYEIRLLAGFELRIDGAPVALPASAQRVLALVAFHRRPLRRAHVSGVLWTDLPEARAGANLRSALWRLGHEAGAVVRRANGQLALTEGAAVDVHLLIERADRLLDPAAEVSVADLRRDGLAAELLPDWYEEWLLPQREHLRQLQLHALEALGQRLLALDRCASAVAVALEAVTLDPLRESSNRLLVEAHLAEGNASEAVSQQRRYTRLLRSELGIEPSPRFDALRPAMVERRADLVSAPRSYGP